MTEPVLTQWVVYAHPTDHPDHYVVRMWRIYPGRAEPSQVMLLAEDLEGARRMVPPGLHRLPRAAGDDPVIVETWI